MLFNGQSIHSRELQVSVLRRKIGMVFSVPVILPMTIDQNLAFGLNLDREGRSRREEKVEKALREAYLWDEVKDRLHEPARNLSGGSNNGSALHEP